MGGAFSALILSLSITLSLSIFSALSDARVLLLATAVRLIKGENEGGANDCTERSLLSKRSTSVVVLPGLESVSGEVEVVLVEVTSVGKVIEVVEEEVSEEVSS